MREKKERGQATLAGVYQHWWLSIPKRYARNLRDYAFGCQDDLNGPDPGIGRHAYPALEYYLVNKTLVPSRVMSLPREADARRRTLTEVMFKANPVAMLSPELLSNVQALESNSGQDLCQHAKTTASMRHRLT